MTTFQLLVIPLLLIVALLDLRGLIAGRGNVALRLARVVLWLVAAMLVAQPALSSWLAGLVGIGRGADLVIYSFMLVAPIAWFHLHTKHYSLERKLVQLARAEALRSPIRGAGLDEGRTET